MSRYIDSDMFDDTIQRLNEQGWGITRGEYKRMSNILFEMPTADVVDVVRCKECKHGEEKDYVPTKYSRFRWYCKNSANYHSKDFYCSMGEKKGEEDAT